MRTSALAALLLPALLAGCLGGEAPRAPTGQIDGAVVDHLLHPFSDQAVYLSPLGLSDRTSQLGGFTFRNVPVGAYTLLTAHEGTQGAAAVVEVEEDRVSKVILQLLPTPVREPHMDILPSQRSVEEQALWSAECTSCARSVVLDGAERPAEVVLEFHWDSSLLGEHGDDAMRFQVVDDKGDLLYRGTTEDSPASVTVDGGDIPGDVRELRVQAWFGPGFTPRANFNLDSLVTIYYGATSDELFGS